VKLAAVSVDIDEIDNYAAIFGLTPASGEAPLDVSLTAVYDKALPRLAELFGALDVPCTFFAIGRDLTRAQNAAQLRALHAAGHEIANHSLNHFYDLTRRDRGTQQREVRGGADAIEAAVGVRPVGFRAPGYTITDQLFEVLASEGVRYDSSVFPCPPYYFAKAAAIGMIKARGRASRSVVDDPRVLTAPVEPYYVGRPYYKRGSGLREFPIGVSGDWSLRLPYIGTTVALAGETGARWLTKLSSTRSFVNLELHGIDLSDAKEDGLLGLAPYQQDLKRSAADKRAALASAFEELKRQGYTFVTLAEATRRLA
jgi:peptidoglycan/xylan/chitin deacetylase (PgdA/CDA1 family)